MGLVYYRRRIGALRVLAVLSTVLCHLQMWRSTWYGNDSSRFLSALQESERFSPSSELVSLRSNASASAPPEGSEKLPPPSISLWPNHSCEPRNDSKPLQFIHVPKTAGSTLEKLAIDQGVEWGYCLWGACGKNGTSAASLPRPSSVTFSKVPSVHHIPIQYTHHPETLAQTKMASWFLDHHLFAVVRNPFHRLLSEWNYSMGFHRRQSAQRDNASKMNRQVQSWVRTVLDSRPRRPGDLPGKQYFIKDGHLVPQVDYITNLAAQRIDEPVTILRMENLHQELACLLQSHNLDWNLAEKRENASGGKLTVANFTAETRQLITEAYADDFRYFGYDTLLT